MFSKLLKDRISFYYYANRNQEINQSLIQLLLEKRALNRHIYRNLPADCPTFTPYYQALRAIFGSYPYRCLFHMTDYSEDAGRRIHMSLKFRSPRMFRFAVSFSGCKSVRYNIQDLIDFRKNNLIENILLDRYRLEPYEKFYYLLMHLLEEKFQIVPDLLCQHVDMMDKKTYEGGQIYLPVHLLLKNQTKYCSILYNEPC